MEKLKSTNVYVLSIISFLCCCAAGLGIFLAAPAYFMANNKLKEADANPDKYEPESVKAMKTAKIIAMVALIINALYLVYSVWYYSTNWDTLMEQINTILEQQGQ